MSFFALSTAYGICGRWFAVRCLKELTNCATGCYRVVEGVIKWHWLPVFVFTDCEAIINTMAIRVLADYLVLVRLTLLKWVTTRHPVLLLYCTQFIGLL